jgi:asparagine synthase (glutamine-hydrolysing)
MGCRYLLLPGEHASTVGKEFSDTSKCLLREGLVKRSSFPGSTLFASAETPTLRLPGGAIVIGHVFSDTGELLGETSSFVSTLAPEATVSALIERCWGDYILIQPGQGQAPSLQVMRDPSGGVACAYCGSGDSWFVTSDISIATRSGLYQRRVDWDFLAHFLAYPYVKTERTGLVGIRELLPGSILRLDGVEATVGQVWSPWRFVCPPHRLAKVEDAALQLRAAVEGTVAAYAAVDKAALIELSGGLDSSVVAASLGGTSARMHCLTIVPTLPGADERLYAESLTRSLGVHLHAQTLDVASAHFDDAVPEWTLAPGGGPLQTAVDQIMARAAIREDLRCFYSGGGGDTVFGYLGGVAPAVDTYRELGLGGALRAVRDLSELHRCTFWRAAKLTLQHLASSGGQPTRANEALLDRSRVPARPDSHPWWQAPPGVLPGDRERVDGLAATQLFRDTLPRGMQHWFRLPLLSQPVMEACLSVPSWMWITGGSNRAVARLAFSDVLPAPVLHRRSKGNFSQYNGAVYRRNKDSMRRFLLEGHLQAHGLLDADALSEYFGRPLAPRDRSFMRIFDLCRTENWVRHQG